MNEAQAKAAFQFAIENYEQDFGTFFLARFFGFEISYGDDHCSVSFDVRDYMFNPQGSLHGGVIGMAMDISMGHLLRRKLGPGATLEMKVQYLRPVRSGRVVCEAQFLKSGRNINFLRSQMFDAERTLIAEATATWQLLQPSAPAGNLL